MYIRTITILGPEEVNDTYKTTIYLKDRIRVIKTEIRRGEEHHEKYVRKAINIILY